MDNTFGLAFRCTTFGESHGGAVGVIVDGCPSGHKIDLGKVQAWLNRRRPGQSHLASPRDEKDQVQCLSGLAQNVTLGTPITLMVPNQDQKADHYSDLQSVYRPSHADYTTDAKWGVKAPSGGGRASARETIGRVAAAAIAEQILEQLVPDFKAVAWVEAVKDQEAIIDDMASVTRDLVDQTPLRCPHPERNKVLEAEIIKAKKKGDSVGGMIRCHIQGCPPGIGGPVFDKLEAELAKAMMSLPASKGFEIGSGFAGTTLYGSEHNDAFYRAGDQIRTKTNRSGGIQGGITNGEAIHFRVAFKPVATIFKKQDTVTRDGDEVHMKPRQGRHDPCVLPRAVPMVEAMAILTIMDHILRQKIVEHTRGPDFV